MRKTEKERPNVKEGRKWMEKVGYISLLDLLNIRFLSFPWFLGFRGFLKKLDAAKQNLFPAFLFARKTNYRIFFTTYHPPA